MVSPRTCTSIAAAPPKRKSVWIFRFMRARKNHKTWTTTVAAATSRHDNGHQDHETKTHNNNKTNEFICLIRLQRHAHEPRTNPVMEYHIKGCLVARVHSQLNSLVLCRLAVVNSRDHGDRMEKSACKVHFTEIHHVDRELSDCFFFLSRCVFICSLAALMCVLHFVTVLILLPRWCVCVCLCLVDVGEQLGLADAWCCILCKHHFT